MKQNIKLICIDMDGTLLNSNHEVSERNKEALRKANSLGVNIAITTGRLFGSARYFADLIGIDSPVIGSNGAYIKHKYDDIAILENPIPKDIAIEIYKIVKKHGLSINFNSWDTLIREDKVPETHAYTIMNKDLPDDRKVKFIVNSDVIETLNNFDGKILKGIVIEESENKDNLWAAKNELKETFGDKLHVVSSGTDNFEVMFGTTSKGNAVAHLADILNVNQEEVMCIGDSENDISMLKFAGVSVAMGNGLQMVKDIADFVTDTNNNDGVAKAIEMFVLK
ncbi:Cof-type HAD-IIB family hydrolase [Clostridium sp.]|uniref:Cof-type HAD-IIB family hydrolase n=1 Tax=Clostridium sp. TaxID=1506 RepID=UPI0025C18602|nr:Cof-type HAD-IIB family hydrolase [Clostridium sp.]